MVHSTRIESDEINSVILGTGQNVWGYPGRDHRQGAKSFFRKKLGGRRHFFQLKKGGEVFFSEEIKGRRFFFGQIFPNPA